MRYWLRNFLASRYGFDLLGYVLLGTSAGLMLFQYITGRELFSLLACIALFWACSRAFSGNIHKRWEENRKFKNLGSGVCEWFQGRRARHAQRRDYKFFRCPGCHNYLRVPRGKGRLHITCPRCGHRFIGKT